MGFRIKIDGVSLEVGNFTVSEASSPLAAGDSTGQTGTFTFTVPAPDPYLSPNDISNRIWKDISRFGPQHIIGLPVEILDSRKGFTVGTLQTFSWSNDGATITYTGASRLFGLNVYGIQAEPFVGTLKDAFLYYLSLAGETSGIVVDPSIEARPVVLPGWRGELWFYLKQLAVAEECDVSLVSGNIILRPVRTRVATNNRDTARTTSAEGQTLAQSVEVYRYNNTPITDSLVYPPGGWKDEVEVLNVNAGETAEYTLELSASVSSIQTPVMTTLVPQDYSASSVYTVVADDGLPVSPSLWAQKGGSVEVSVNPDTTSLRVVLVGATGVPNKNGQESSNFSIALGSDYTGNRYSTLRIVGTGVSFDKQLVTIPTGVGPSRTATEVGVTIDNPFLSTFDQVYSAGTRAARTFAGPVWGMTGTVTAINRRGDSGQETYPTYTLVQTQAITALGAGATYAAVESWMPGGPTYGGRQDYWNAFVRDDDADQVFGNVAGARIYDRRSARWYRIRSGDLTPSTIGISGDDDLLFSDLQDYWAARTYANVEASRFSFSYTQDDMIGMKGQL